MPREPACAPALARTCGTRNSTEAPAAIVAAASIHRRLMLLRPTIAPERDPRHAIVRAAGMKPARDEIGSPIPGQVTAADGHEVGRRVCDVVKREPHTAVVLEPHQALCGRIVPVVVRTDDGHVEVAVTVEICRLWT